jgi:hypothetical protein
MEISRYAWSLKKQAATHTVFIAGIFAVRFATVVGSFGTL